MSIIVVSKVASPATAQYQEFLARCYIERYGIEPGLTQHLFAACEANRVVGTIGMEVAASDWQMRLARIYTVNKAKAPIPFETSELVECGRWTGKKPGLAPALLFSMCAHAHSMGKRVGWCEHKRPVHRTVRRLGVQFSPAGEAAVLQPREIPCSERFLYHSKDPPKLYFFKVEQALSALRLLLPTIGYAISYDSTTTRYL